MGRLYVRRCHGQAGELIVADGKGVWKTWSVHRKPIGDMWHPAVLDLVKHSPWRPSDDDPDMDGEMSDVIKLKTLAKRRKGSMKSFQHLDDSI